MNTITPIPACRFGGNKPLMTRLRERGHRPGDMPLGFGTMLEVWELFPGEQQVWKFGIVMLVIGGGRKFFNWLGEFGIRQGDKAYENGKVDMMRQDIAELDRTEDFEDFFRRLPSNPEDLPHPGDKGEE